MKSASCTADFRPPASELPGAQTLVTKPDGTQPGETTSGQYKQRALPSPPWKREKPTGKPEFNTPPGSTTGQTPDNKSLHEDRVRTKGLPGDESPHPNEEPTQTPRRRPGLHASEEVVDASMVSPGRRVPLNRNRQKKQTGKAKRYYKQYYQRNRKKIQRRMTRWFRRHRLRFNYKKDQKRRREYPQRFKRKPGGFNENRDRSLKWREDQAKKNKSEKSKSEKNKIELEKKAQLTLDPPVWFVYLPTNTEGVLLSVDPDAGTATVAYTTETDWLPEQDIDLEDFFNKTLISEESDISRLTTYLDQVFEYAEGEDEDEDDGEDDPDLESAFNEWAEGRSFSLPKHTEEELSQRVACRYSEMLYDKRPPEGEPSNYYNRGSEPYWREIEQSDEPAGVLDEGQVDNNPGSAKVIPEGHDFENKNDRKDTFKVAVRISEIFDSCSPGVTNRSLGMPVRMVRSDPKHIVWLFDVTGETGTYRVRVKAVPKGNIRDILKTDVKVSCSCPFFRWQGPEHWAKQQGYLYGKPRGTASRPDIKDPKGVHGVCKHVLAVLRKVSEFILPRLDKVKGEGKGKTASSLRYLADMLRYGRIFLVAHGEEEMMTHRVARRYVRRTARRFPC